MNYLNKILKENKGILGKNCNIANYDFYDKKILHNPSTNAKPIMNKNEQQKLFNEVLNLDVRNREKTSIYIHIPFCKTDCSYCGFYINPSKKDLLEEYVEALLKEIYMAKNIKGIKNKPFHCVYFGGGTPTDLEPIHIKKISKALKDTFTLVNDCEFTVESRFSSIDDEKIEAWVEAGMNRISLGVQSFDSKVRKSLGRIDKKEVLLNKLKKLVNDDRFCVVIDLMYGLPYQSFEVWKEDIKLLIESKVDGADIYQLVMFENSKLNKKVQENKIPYDFTNKEKFQYFEYAVKTLDKYSFKRLSTQHFGKDNRERNFYNTFSKEGASTFQLGSGAGGRIQNCAMMNHRELSKYIQSVNENEKPIAFMSKGNPQNKLLKSLTSQIATGYINKFLLKEFCSKEEFILLNEILYYLKKLEILKKRSEDIYDLTVIGQFWYTNLTISINKIFHIFNKKD